MYLALQLSVGLTASQRAGMQSPATSGAEIQSSKISCQWQLSRRRCDHDDEDDDDYDKIIIYIILVITMIIMNNSEDGGSDKEMTCRWIRQGG